MDCSRQVVFLPIYTYNWVKEVFKQGVEVGILGMLEHINENRDEVLAIAERYGATNVRIFGSVARGEDDDQSDIDFLIDFAPGRSLFDLGALLMELNTLLGKQVDVTTEKGLKRRIRERVLREAVSL